MENVLVPLAILIVVGAVLSWLGRTPLTLIISYLVVGVVAVFVAYVGFEVFMISVAGNSYAEKINHPILRYILEVFNLKPLAAFFGMFKQEQRGVILLIITVVSVIAATLPFVTFANAVYAAMTADEGKTETTKVGKNIQKEIIDLKSENGRQQHELMVELVNINSGIQTLSSRVDEIERINKLEASTTIDEETLQ